MAIPGGHPLEGGRARRGVWRAQDDLESPASGAADDVRGQRPEDLDAGNPHRLGRGAAARFGALAIRIGDQQPGQDAGRRIAEQLAGAAAPRRRTPSTSRPAAARTA